MARDDERQGTTAGGTGSFLMAAPVAVPPRSAASFPLRTIVAVALAAGLIGMAVSGGWGQSQAGAGVPTAAPTVGPAAQPLPTAFTAYVGAADPGRLAAASSILGRQISLGSDSFDKRSWSEIFDDKWAIDGWKRSGDRMIWAVQMLPALSRFSLAAGAAGNYDNYFYNLAENLVAAGMGNSILRLGWEFNQSKFPWYAAGQSSNFVGYWRQIVTTMRTVPGANFEFVWNPSRGDNGPKDQAMGNLANYYPGDAYVDMIGMDVYDDAWKVYPGAAAEFQKILTQTYGLAWLANFAAVHDKPIAFPEFGLGTGPSAPNSGPITGSGDVSGGDDPTFINDMFNWIDHHEVTYVAYWDFGSSSIQNGQNPLAADALRAGLTGLTTSSTVPPTNLNSSVP